MGCSDSKEDTGANRQQAVRTNQMVVQAADAAAVEVLENRPVVVVSRRTIQEGKMDDYKVAYDAAWAHLQATVPGMKSLMCNVDKNDPNVVHDVQWFKSMDAFMAHADMNAPGTMDALMGFVSLYEKVPLTGTVWGSWDDRAKELTGGFGAQFNFVTSKAGFIRDEAGGRAGPPSIVASQRRVKPGKMKEQLAAYKALGDWYRKNNAGVIAFCAAADNEDPNLIHDLQCFADDEGFMSHADMSNPEIKMLIGGLMENYDWEGEIKPVLGGNAWAKDVKGVEEMTGSMGAVFNVMQMPPPMGGIDLTRGD